MRTGVHGMKSDYTVSRILQTSLFVIMKSSTDLFTEYQDVEGWDIGAVQCDSSEVHPNSVAINTV